MLRQSERMFVSPLLQSLGIRHGFTTRLQGTSSGVFTSLNLHDRVGDELECVKLNLSLLAEEARFSLSSLCQVFQVHGNRVILLENAEMNQQEADGMITGNPLVLSIRIADCVPILLADGRGHVAAIHAGWRGTAQKIAQQAVVAFSKFQVSPDQIYAALGPSIGPCCFQVGIEVADVFRQLVPEAVLQDSPSAYRIDLWKINQHLLESVGLSSQNIDNAPLCTSCHPDLFFSHRRDQGHTGRHLAFIVGGI